MVERKDPEQFVVIGVDQDEARAFADHDFKIRSGLCQNGHGLLAVTGKWQSCAKCGFFTNVKAEQEPNT